MHRDCPMAVDKGGKMKTIIISFKPEVFPALLTKEKKFEYRSKIPEGMLEVYLYLSSPVKMIVGKLILGERMPITELLNNDSKAVKANLEKHMSEGVKFCSPIISISLFRNPVSLAEAKAFSPNFSAPQLYTYAENYPELNKALKERIIDFYDINSVKAIDKLGLFSYEIIEKFPRQIELPVYLKEYKIFR